MKSEARKTEILKIYAFSQGRKELEKALSNHRKLFNKAKAEYDAAEAQLSKAQVLVEKARLSMADARKGIIETSEALQIMDLTGAEGIKERNDAKTYLIDGREYHVKKDKNDVKVTPWREWKKQQNACSDLEEADPDTVFEAAKKFLDASK